jgi:quercetin dioxygenase-like cupin family protein
MRVTDLEKIPIFEEWVGSSSERAPMRTAFVSFEGRAPAGSTLIYMVLDDHCIVGTHTDSSEEVILCLEGNVIVQLDGAQTHLHAGCMLLVPAGARHALQNASAGRARAIGFFASPTVSTTFQVPLSSVR